MTKAELIDVVSQKTGFTKTDTQTVINAVLVSVKEAILDSEPEVILQPLGRFVTSIRSAREARNPATGETMTVPAKRVVTFKVTGSLKSELGAQKIKRTK